MRIPQQGDIIRAYITDIQNRNPKHRPFLVLRAETVGGRTIIVGVGITGAFTKPLAPEEVELPYNTNGNAMSGLTKPSVAHAKWLRRIEPEQVERFYGKVLPKYVAEVVKRLPKPKP